MAAPAQHDMKRRHEVAAATDAIEQLGLGQQDDVDMVGLGSPAPKKARAEAPTESGTAGAPQENDSNTAEGQPTMDAADKPTGHPEQPKKPPASAPASAPGAPTGPTTAAGPVDQLLHHLAAAAQLLVASTQSMHAPRLTGEQLSGLHDLNGQLTQLLGKLDAQAVPPVADRAKQGRMGEGQQAKQGTVPQHVLRSTLTPRVVMMAALDRQISRGSAPAAGTSKGMRAGGSPGSSKDRPASAESAKTGGARCGKGAQTKSDAESCRVKGKKGKGEAPAAGSMCSTAAAAASNPLADGAAAAAAGEDMDIPFADRAAAGPLRYTADFMQTLLAANARRPPDMNAGEWDSNPPDEEMPYQDNDMHEASDHPDQFGHGRSRQRQYRR